MVGVPVHLSVGGGAVNVSGMQDQVKASPGANSDWA